ncbi:MAG TPA: M28 family peptidase [Methylomirabilota bacterium]|nr:M28 family peptidase [Methylomirabilota bacterium]
MRLAVAIVVLVAASVVEADPAPATRRAGFDGARAYRDVERLVAIGPRPAGSPGSARAREYIVGELKKAGVQARVEPFEAETPHGRLSMANVVGVLPGRRPEVILIGGHYDTKWFSDIRFVGANDGGSSTALLLELARQLRGRTRDYTYWIVFFDGEEARETWTAGDSLYGSRRMAAELRRAGRLPRAMIVADMIGDRDLGIRREALSTSWLTELVWGSAARLNHQTHFLADQLAVEDDHAPFLEAGVPAVLLIDFDFPPWHTAADTLDKVSPRSLQIVGEVLLDALPAVEARLARGDGVRRAR